MTTDKEKFLEEKIRFIKNHLKETIRYDGDFLPRPFFIEITGTPSAGKSTTIEKLYDALRRQGLRTRCPEEGAKVINYIPRDTPLYNLTTALYALPKLIEMSAGHNHDLVIFERCIFDACCWMRYWNKKNKLSEEEMDLYQNFFLSRFWLDKIDVAYFMICDPDVAVERDLKDATIKTLGNTTNPSSIKNLVSIYKEAYEKLHPVSPQLFIIDTTNMTTPEMVDFLTTKTLTLLEEKIKNGL